MLRRHDDDDDDDETTTMTVKMKKRAREVNERGGQTQDNPLFHCIHLLLPAALGRQPAWIVRGVWFGTRGATDTDAHAPLAGCA